MIKFQQNWQSFIERIGIYLTRLKDWFAPQNELEFLPAALEIVETPPSPIGHATVWVIVAFFLITVLWACLGKVDIVAVAQGKIVPSGRVKVIQPLESGVVKIIYVEDGQQVKKGDSLVELDSTMSGADKTRFTSELIASKLDRIRLEALLKNTKKKTKQKDSKKDEKKDGISEWELILREKIPENIPEPQSNVMIEQWRSQLNEYHAQLASLKERISEQHSEYNATENRIDQLNKTIPLITERTEAIKKMLSSGVVSRAQWLEVEEERITQVKDRDIQKNNLNRIRSAVIGAEQASYASAAKFQSDWLAELHQIENKIYSFEQELVKATQRQFLQNLTAPISGTVQQLATHTVGGVVTPAQELMRIVPEHGAIEVEAWLQNKDIGFVEEGHSAEIKIDTFPFTKYGVIDGEVVTLSNDAVPNEDLGLIYTAKVSMKQTQMQVNNKLVNLSPGMTVSVEVKIGKRRIIEYILSPLLRYKEESIQER